MNRYYLKFRDLTGLGSPVQTRWFSTIEERYAFSRLVVVVGFGQRGRNDF